MESILPTNEYTEVEGRAYSNPQIGLDESTSFIDNLRATQGQQNQEIAEQTYNLGTAVPSVQGGLGTNTPANMNYFTSRYQTPMTNSNVANLRAAAQATALNEVLANEQAIWKKRYQDAYKAYQKRNYDRAKSAYYGGGGGNNGGNGDIKGGVDTINNDGSRKVASVEPAYSPMGSGDFSYTSDASKLSGGGTLPSNSGATIAGPSNTLTPNGNVNIQRNKYGDITSLTYNGKTFTGDAAKQRYQWLQSIGTIGGRN